MKSSKVKPDEMSPVDVFIIMGDFVVFHATPVQERDKITSRYGGKGVISQIVPDDEMPRLGEAGRSNME